MISPSYAPAGLTTLTHLVPRGTFKGTLQREPQQSATKGSVKEIFRDASTNVSHRFHGNTLGFKQAYHWRHLVTMSDVLRAVLGLVIFPCFTAKMPLAEIPLTFLPRSKWKQPRFFYWLSIECLLSLKGLFPIQGRGWGKNRDCLNSNTANQTCSKCNQMYNVNTSKAISLTTQKKST